MAVAAGAATAFSVAVASAPACAVALSPGVSVATSDAGSLGGEKYPIGFPKAATISANRRKIFSAGPLIFEQRRQHFEQYIPQCGTFRRSNGPSFPSA